MNAQRGSCFAAVVGVLILPLLAAAVTHPLDDPTKPAGQIIVDPANPRWLKRNGGGPLFMAGPGDPEGFLFRGTRNLDGTRDGDQTALIEKLADSGANCIYMQIVRSHGGDGAADHNPFSNFNDPTSSLNPNILAQWETWFTMMDDHEIVIYLFFYDDSARPFGGKNRNIGNGSAEDLFLRGIVDAFEHHRNLIWVVAEEYSEAHSTADVRRIAEIIRDSDDHDHVIAVHQLSGIVFDFADDADIDQFAIQRSVSGADGIHDAVVDAWNLAAGRYNLCMSESSQHYNAGNPDRDATRRYTWAAAMAGAYVMVLRMDIAGTPDEILADHGRIVRFFEATRVNRMAPHDEMALGDTDYVLANPGDSYIAYASTGGAGLGLKALPEGSYSLRWVNPATGAEHVETDTTVTTGDRIFARPVGFDDDVALYLERRNVVPLPVVPVLVAIGAAVLLVGSILLRRRASWVHDLA